LERVEKVVDLRLDIVKRTESAPGMWPVATLYKKMKLAKTSGAKDDKGWAECLSQANLVKGRSKIQGVASGRLRMISLLIFFG
jgi:hypothetical protein